MVCLATFPGFFRSGKGDAETFPGYRNPMRKVPIKHKVPKTSAALDFTILGLKRQNIQAAKSDIDRCCAEEAADNYISGSEFSDIIASLDQSEVYYHKISKPLKIERV